MKVKIVKTSEYYGGELPIEMIGQVCNVVGAADKGVWVSWNGDKYIVLHEEYEPYQDVEYHTFGDMINKMKSPSYVAYKGKYRGKENAENAFLFFNPTDNNILTTVYLDGEFNRNLLLSYNSSLSEDDLEQWVLLHEVKGEEMLKKIKAAKDLIIENVLKDASVNFDQNKIESLTCFIKSVNNNIHDTSATNNHIT